jgi:glycerate 2-kinase
MRVLLAIDKFKGSLTAAEVVAELEAGLHEIDPALHVTSRPIADGGDGTLDAALHAGFTAVEVVAAGPTGALRPTSYARRDDTAVVELATVCGLTLLGGALDPLGATSFGLGTVIGAALDAGVRQILVGIGGSASTDGGAGLLQALGARVVDATGTPVRLGGGGLADVASVDLTGLHPRLREAQLTVASDVDNPLCGPGGAAAVYGPQKGATADQVAQLDAALGHFAGVIASATGRDVTAVPGAGAAGGVGFGALVIGASIRSGIELVLELVGFAGALESADLVITGEGSLDTQTLAGKAPAGVAAAARAKGIRALAVAGRSSLSPEQLAGAGIERVYALTDLEPDPARCMVEAASLLRRTGNRIAADLLAAAVPHS